MIYEEGDYERNDWQLRPEVHERDLQARAEALTSTDVEAALRAHVYENVRLQDGSFASLTIDFQRTLRIPDDGKVYPLPAGMGEFPLRSVDDFSGTVPEEWSKRGGILMPMFQSEALGINFSSRYPFALKVGAGKIDAISGQAWTSDLHHDPQNYVVLPDQPWLDGFSVGEGVIRQFVAMPLGAGYSVEEQLTGKADMGGIQLQAYPLSAEAYFRDEVTSHFPEKLSEFLPRLFESYLSKAEFDRCFAPPRFSKCAGSMGLGMGGTMRQEIYADERAVADWDQTQTSRCFVHLCNSLIWRQITGENPPHPPLTATEYKKAGIPWFDTYRDDLKAVKGSTVLAKVKSIFQLGQEKKSQPLPDNSSLTPEVIVQYGNTRRPGEIREFFDSP